MRCDEKGISLRLSLFIIHLIDLLSVSIQKIVSEEEDLVVRKVPLIWYCSKFDNTDD